MTRTTSVATQKEAMADDTSNTPVSVAPRKRGRPTIGGAAMSNATRSQKKRAARDTEIESALLLLSRLAALAAQRDPAETAFWILLSEKKIAATQKVLQRIKWCNYWQDVSDAIEPHMPAARDRLASAMTRRHEN